ncbi:uncharacterized protein LOC135932296 [Pelmatolapia mariae]|uniref:uncharacterized protein LOC135932296 n=1 Tax=Pelmatolapia mariae TaxID=158779 RepID=UPI003211F72B
MAVLLHPRTVIGTLEDVYVVSLPAGVTEIPSNVATMASHTATPTVQDQMARIDLSKLSAEEQGQVRSLLKKYSSVFSAHDTDLGCTNLISHDIPLLDDIPVRQRYRRIPPSDYEVVKEHINQLLGAKVIRESSSPYASPIVLVKKKDGSPRMCVDYRQLNNKTRKDAFPLPRIEESLDALTGARWFSTMDLASGYNQVPVTEEDRPKTAFCTPFGLFEWNRMPFGLCNAPSTFQRLMQRLFGDQQCQSLLLYLDDIVIFSSTVQQHLERLDVVLGRLQQEGLKAKLAKCAFFQREVRYLGHVISDQGVSTDPSKVEVVANWQSPKTASELRSFLGFASYYRRFVEGFAKLAAPLHRLVAEWGGRKSKKRSEHGVAENWTAACAQSFEALKTKLTTAPVLAYADFSLPFILEVDASHGGLGAVLSQEQGGKVRPIAYASRGLRPTERNMLNYSSMKLEFLALKWAMTEKFREYLLGHKCIVYTDNNPLNHLSSAKLGATEQRWAAQLASFDFDLKYRSGRSNTNADVLSRQHPPDLQEIKAMVPGTALPEPLQQALRLGPAEVSQAAITVLPHLTTPDLHTLQQVDPVIKEILVFWRRKQRPSFEERQQLSPPALVLLRQWDRLIERDGVLYRQVHRPDGAEVVLQLLLPSALIEQVLTHQVTVTYDIPVRQRYRRIPPSDYEVVKEHINQLLGAKVIRESSSPYASPIVLVKKKDGSPRMCVDYRQLNNKTRKDAFPLPRIEESLDALTGARWFSTMDLASGYNQVPVTEEDRPKTAFCTPFGLFEWNRMPFGLCNAPSTFQRLMQRLFGDQQCQSLLLYLDDIVIFSSTVQQHLERLDVVLGRLQQEGLKAKLAKCAFFQREVRYLGHVISDQGVSTDPSKVEVVANWQSPKTASELRSFLGFASYYRRFVEGFAKLAAPLHRLVAEWGGRKSKKRSEHGVAENWTAACAQSFEALKTKLTTAPVLAYADFSLPFILEVDASHGGLGAVLSQEQGGKVRPIAYASRGLRPTERNMLNYSSMKLEFLALKWAMTEKFREYLLGHKCIVYTDNNPLNHLSSAKLGATEQRWAAQLASFDFDLKYRSGRSNTNADVLSRQHPPDLQEIKAMVPGTALPEPLQQALRLGPAEVSQAAITVLPHLTTPDLHTLQQVDPVIKEILVFWRRKQRPSFEERQQLSPPALVLLRQWDRLIERDGVLYRQVHRPDGAEVVLQLLLPSALIEQVLTHQVTVTCYS